MIKAILAASVAVVILGGGVAIAALNGPEKPTNAVLYLRARQRALDSYRDGSSADSEAMASLISSVRRECGGVLSGAPEVATLPADSKTVKARSQIGSEAFNAVDAAQLQSQRGAIESFAHTVAGLKWRNPKITRLLHTFAASELRLHSIAVPDICKVSRQWVASNYGALPPRVGRALQYTGQMIVTEELELGCNLTVSPKKAVLAEMKRVGGTQAAKLVDTVRRTEAEVERDEYDHAASYAASLKGVLGLNAEADYQIPQEGQSPETPGDAGITPEIEKPLCSGPPSEAPKEVRKGRS